jgi:hypothetical protein
MLYSESASNEDSRDVFTKIPEEVGFIVAKADEFEGTDDELRDYLFHEYAKQALIEDFKDGLYNYEDGDDYFEDEEISVFLQTLLDCPDNDLISALAVPWELRKTVFQNVRKSIKSGMPVEDVCKDYVKKLAERGYSIGFHTSPSDIRPSKVEVIRQGGARETLSWNIKPTEADHRDNDLARAYYSSKYRHLYKKQNSRYIYIVRTDPDNKTDGNWSRASGLSVIARLPLKETIDFVETITRDHDKKEAPAA